MPRARWWLIGGLSVVTAVVVTLDVTGVIFTDAVEPTPPKPVAVPQLPDAAAALPAAMQPGPATTDPRLVRAVKKELSVDALGSSVHAVVAALAAPGSSWLDIDGGQLAAPASTLKLLTATALLGAYSPQDRIDTTTGWDADAQRVVVVGGGDATLTSETTRGAPTASLQELARSTAKALRRLDVATVSLGYDDRLFTGPDVSKQWERIYVASGVIAPVTALMADQGRVAPGSTERFPDPALGAAERFAELLADQGITVKGVPKAVGGAAADPLATVVSPPMSDLVERMLRDSDNQLAEALGRLAAVAQGEPGSFGGVATALDQAAAAQGIDLGGADIFDASGLARADSIPAESLVELLSAASAEPGLGSVLSGLAVAGFDGTLADRFTEGDAAAGAGVVRAKTGTLTGISAESGIVTTCDGDLVAFAFLADEVGDTDAARAALDDAAAALATCPQQR